ncbi:MAG: cytosolic protein [Thermodesulfobacteriota bacterium]
MTSRDEYDSPWKEILSLYFQEFMEFFFPEIAKEIDWRRGYELLDKELRQITRESEVGFRLADNLVKVWKKDGQEAWVLVHVEVQGQEEKEFGHRVFVYHYRIHDLHKRPVVSLAILADENPGWYIHSYEQELWGCRTNFDFPAVKLLAYRDQWEILESSSNPFAVVVMAHLRTMETRKNQNERLHYKLTLSKNLYRGGWTRQDIINLYRFIDWIMRLPEDLEKSYFEELVKLEEEVKMPYVTTAERIGFKKGEKEKALKTAMNLLALGILTEDQIAQVTELNIEEIRRIKENMKISPDE